jgi:hypothetical protein
MSFRVLESSPEQATNVGKKISIADVSIEFMKKGVFVPAETTSPKSEVQYKDIIRAVIDNLKADKSFINELAFNKLATYHGGSDIFFSKSRTLITETEQLSLKDGFRYPSATGVHLVVIDGELYLFENGVKYKINKTLA